MMPRPTTGDLAQIIVPGRGPSAGASRVGRVVRRDAHGVVVRLIGEDRPRRVTLDHVRGWWPKGARNRSLHDRREVEAGGRRGKRAPRHPTMIHESGAASSNARAGMHSAAPPSPTPTGGPP